MQIIMLIVWSFSITHNLKLLMMFAAQYQMIKFFCVRNGGCEIVKYFSQLFDE